MIPRSGPPAPSTPSSRRTSSRPDDGYLRFDYSIQENGDDAIGDLSADLLRRLITRELVRLIAGELGVPYEEKREADDRAQGR